MAFSKKYLKIYEAVKLIPAGKVATYGQIAEIAGFPHQARMVGYALHSTPEEIKIPWHRVVNSQGKISLRGSACGGDMQRALLENEGVKFSEKGTISLTKYRWLS